MTKPRRPVPRRRPAGPRPPGTLPRSGHPTILLVDDDPAVRESLCRVLQTEGWSIITASCGEDALEYLLAHEPDLMITDLSMAAVSGWDLLFHETLQRPNLPIFVITALPLSSVGGADTFASEFFEKPLDLDSLLAVIHRYVDVAPAASAPE